MGESQSLRDGAGAGKPGGLRIAVIGAGIAGLAAAYRLGARHRVTVYERHATPGLAIHGVVGGAGESRVDIPLRVFTDRHYRALFGLLADLGVETESIPYSCAYVRLGDGDANAPALPTPFFRFGRGPGGGDDERMGLARGDAEMVSEHLAFIEKSEADVATGATRGVSLGEYLRARFRADYVDAFLLPSFAAICTCRFETAERFPADIALDLLTTGIFEGGLSRVKGGIAVAADAFVRRLEDFRGSTEIAELREVRGGGADADDPEVGVEVVEVGGATSRFDHVVVATTADEASRLAARSDAERALLASVRMEPARVVVHRDPRLLPEPAERCAFTLVFDPRTRETSPSLWVNTFQPDLAEPTIQTVNPLVEPAPALVLADLSLERAIVLGASEHIPDELARLHAEPGRRVWLCGAYAARGVPLLESGVRSAEAVVGAIEGLR